jgi:hypothetical protein
MTEIAFIEDAIFDRPQPLGPCTMQTGSEFMVAIA